MVRAVGRLVSSGRELSHLAGYTSRVAELYNVLGDINSGTFVRTQTVREPQEGEERTVDHIDPITSRGELVEIGSSDTRTLCHEPFRSCVVCRFTSIVRLSCHVALTYDFLLSSHHPLRACADRDTQR
jgi:hypothetical protein